MTQRQHADAREMISYRDAPLRRHKERATPVEELNARHVDD